MVLQIHLIWGALRDVLTGLPLFKIWMHWRTRWWLKSTVVRAHRLSTLGLICCPSWDGIHQGLKSHNVRIYSRMQQRNPSIGPSPLSWNCLPIWRQRLSCWSWTGFGTSLMVTDSCQVITDDSIQLSDTSLWNHFSSNFTSKLIPKNRTTNQLINHVGEKKQNHQTPRRKRRTKQLLFHSSCVPDLSTGRGGASVHALLVGDLRRPRTASFGFVGAVASMLACPGGFLETPICFRSKKKRQGLSLIWKSLILIISYFLQTSGLKWYFPNDLGSWFSCFCS